MNTLHDYLLFKKFIMPVALQFLFWAGIGGTLYGTWWLYAHDNWAWLMSLIFGPLATRLIFESSFFATAPTLTSARSGES